MCICTSTPTTNNNNNPMFIPTVDEFKAAVEMTLRDSEWFVGMVEEYASDNLEQAIGGDVDRKLERYFRSFDITDHVDMDREIESALSNYDFDDHINTYMDNNFDPEDYVDSAVTDYMDRRVDVEEIANTEVHDILNNTDFINALALAIVNVRKQQAAERKAKQDQLNQVDTNASL